jgi:hypothetical protein
MAAAVVHSRHKRCTMLGHCCDGTSILQGRGEDHAALHDGAQAGTDLAPALRPQEDAQRP